MSISARKAIKQSTGFRPPVSHRPLQMLIILLMLTCLVAVNDKPAQAANPGEDLPISIVDESYSVELQGEDQQNPTVVALSNKNKWLVVWEDWRNWNTTGADIYGRFIDKNGDYCGNEFIICNQFGNQTVPTLAHRPTDTVLIAWQDSRGSTNSGFLYYKTMDVSLLTADGSGYLLSAETAISYNSIDGDNLLSRKLPKAAYDAPRDQFWLVWIESRDQLQRLVEDPFDGYGSPYWHFGDSNYISFTTVAADSGNVAVPEILRNTGGSSLRTVRKLSSKSEFNETSGTVTYIYEYFTNINNVTVACDDSSAETLIAWEGVRGKATLTCNWTEKDEEEICTGEGDDEVCYPNGNYGRPTGSDLYSSELKTEHDSGGSADGIVHIYSIFDKYITQPVVHSQLIDASEAASYYPALGYDSIHRKFLVAWEEQQDNGFSKVYGQLLFSGGGLYGANHLLSFQDLDGDGVQDPAVQESNQTRPQIAVDTTRQLFFVTWQDGRNSLGNFEQNIDIYGQHVDCEGTLWGGNYPITVAQNNQYNPQTSYNRGSHQFFTVWKDDSNFKASDSDIYGHCFDNGMAEKGYVYSEAESFTADSAYNLWVNAGKSLPGQLYVLLLHDPASAGVVYSLTPTGQLTPFPYTSPNGWQNLFFAQDGRSERIDLHTLDFRQLGCTLCQGKAETEDFNFGDINVRPPSGKPYVNANDFRYLTGDLYIATYLKDSSEAIPFDFNQGLVELHKLTIHNFNGSWRVASKYDGKISVHPNLLVVSEPGDGSISATWSPKYENLAINYAADESAYLLTFNIRAYNYVYKITSLDADKFSGTYTCMAYDEVIAKDQPVCGGRSDAPLESWICSDGNGGATGPVIAGFSGGPGVIKTPPFTTTGPWKINWTTAGYESHISSFDIDIYTANGDKFDYIISGGSASGSSYYPTAGEYYLEIDSGNSDWEIYVVPAE